MQKEVAVHSPQKPGNMICAATFLPLRSYLHLLPFMGMSFAVEKQLKRSKGLIRYGLRTNIPRLHFWTVSIWEDRESMLAFVQTEPHATAVRRFSGWAAEGAAFCEWVCTADGVDWSEIFRKLKKPAFTYKPGVAGISGPEEI
jgi:hypothetical protein